jgi:RNA polymerase sigma factor (TIGR02999 family)
MTTVSHEVTQLLLKWSNGDQEARDQLMPLVYSELHRLAHHYLRRERPAHTLQTTALVHEAYLRLIGVEDVRWQDRNHFLSLAASLMRRILVEYARSHHASKRGGGLKLSFDEAVHLLQARVADLVALDDALTALASIDPRQSRIVELRFFGGLTVEETADVLGISCRTVKREWSVARAWLHRELAKSS